MLYINWKFLTRTSRNYNIEEFPSAPARPAGGDRQGGIKEFLPVRQLARRFVRRCLLGGNSSITKFLNFAEFSFAKIGQIFFVKELYN